MKEIKAIGRVHLMTLIKQHVEKYGDDVDLNHIDVSEITTMWDLFKNSDFSGDISKWNVRNVQNMTGMFLAAKNFNCDISNWDTSHLMYADYMFRFATSFNQDLSKWRVYNLVDIDYMFEGATSFNQDISNWELRDDILCENAFNDCNIKKEYRPSLKIHVNIHYI